MSHSATSGSQDTKDYDLVLKAIQHLEREQPQEFSVIELTQVLGIKPECWKQVIDRWVGVQPKCYLKPLVQECRCNLHIEEFAELDMVNCKLTLPRRLRDVVITWKAMTLKQYKDQFGNPVILYGWFDSPFGEVLSLGTKHGLCEMVFCEMVGRDKAFAVMEKHWPKVKPIEDPDTIKLWTRAAFEGGEVSLLMIGSEFRIRVWKTLLAIPSGKVTNYGTVACKLDKPGAGRAVGGANSRNPMPWLIPCHRVLYSNDTLGGFHLSPTNKLIMLAWEAFRASADSHDVAREHEQDVTDRFSQPVRLIYRKGIGRRLKRG